MPRRPRNLRVEFPEAIYHLAGLNFALPPEVITAAVDELTRDRSAMSIRTTNREIYTHLKDGIRVRVAARRLCSATLGDSGPRESA